MHGTMATRAGGQDRISTKAKLADELVVLGAVLVRARERQKLKQSDVASRLGLPASYLSKVEKGTRRLDVIELVRIAEAMEIDPAELVAELQRALKG
jgi:transcriptional regulator with XRE-family HTH domain